MRQFARTEGLGIPQEGILHETFVVGETHCGTANISAVLVVIFKFPFVAGEKWIPEGMFTLVVINDISRRPQNEPISRRGDEDLIWPSAKSMRYRFPRSSIPAFAKQSHFTKSSEMSICVEAGPITEAVFRSARAIKVRIAIAVEALLRQTN